MSVIFPISLFLHFHQAALVSLWRYLLYKLSWSPVVSFCWLFCGYPLLWGNMKCSCLGRPFIFYGIVFHGYETQSPIFFRSWHDNCGNLHHCDSHVEFHNLGFEEQLFKVMQKFGATIGLTKRHIVCTKNFIAKI